MVQIISDTEMAAILTDMVDSQVPALSLIKSPKRLRDYNSPATKIPDTEPAPKKHKADGGSKSIWNCLTTLETRRAKCKRSLQVPREHAKNSMNSRTPPTAYSTDQNRTSGRTTNSRPPWSRSGTSPCETACPHDQTAGREFSCRQTGHQNPGTATTETSQPTKPDQGLALEL